MAESHAVGGLAAKRPELTGEIAHYPSIFNYGDALTGYGKKK